MTDNSPNLWQAHFPLPTKESHKYTRGHAVIVGGGMEKAGAARLAARAALRIGAGLVTTTCPPEALETYARSQLSVMSKAIDSIDTLESFIGDDRITALCIGPGTGINDFTKQAILLALSLNKQLVIDADGLSVFADDRKTLFKAIQKSTCDTILTPHEGEFERLFGYKPDDRETTSIKAANQSGAITLLKGPETIITSTDGNQVINRNAPPWLATAGAGDVLAGMITGLLAQSMPAFEATCAGAWLHGECANHIGPGLISEDLVEALPEVLNKMLT